MADDLLSKLQGIQQGRRAPRQLRLENCEGVEMRKKTSYKRVFTCVLVGYLWLIFGGPCGRNAKQNNQQTTAPPPKQTIEYILPSSVKHYEASQLEFKTNMLMGGAKQVSKEGVPLGTLCEVYVLNNENGDVAGYLNTVSLFSGLYNNIGQRTGDTYEGKLIDKQGNAIGTLTSKDRKLESVVDENNRKLLKISGTTYGIFVKKPGSTNEYKMLGVVENYQQ